MIALVVNGKKHLVDVASDTPGPSTAVEKDSAAPAPSSSTGRLSAPARYP
jgi:hypothetical protein